MNSGRILIAENNVDIQYLLTTVLTKYSLGVTDSPESTMTKLKNQKFDCLLSDYHFNGSPLNGFDIYKSFREYYSDSPFILFSSEILFVRHQFNDDNAFFVEKPTEIENLVKTIQSVLRIK